MPSWAQMAPRGGVLRRHGRISGKSADFTALLEVGSQLAATALLHRSRD